MFLGDYIDRGPDSKEVVQALVAMQAKPGIEAIFLRGNHEQALLDFLDGVADADAWLFYGGMETLASYGAAPAPGRAQIDAGAARKALSRRLPKRHEAFLRSTTLMAEVGDYAFVHAGVRPGVALSAQAADDLLWIREEFLESRKPAERVIVHGHTPATGPISTSGG